MRFSPGQSGRRAGIAALLAGLALASLLAGCGEDRSNLIPKDTADSLVAKISEVQRLAANGDCFEANDVAASVQAEVESLDDDIDIRLKRSLVNGVNQLQSFVSDPEKCTESETTTVEPTDTEETPPESEGTTGETGTTGTTDTEDATTGPQGTTTDEDQDQQQQDQDDSNDQSPPNSNTTKPPSQNNPTQPNPTTPTPPSGTGPGSGGLGPG
jgi:hypothetical protein